jgi:hypothetical protein
MESSPTILRDSAEDVVREAKVHLELGERQLISNESGIRGQGSAISNQTI